MPFVVQPSPFLTDQALGEFSLQPGARRHGFAMVFDRKTLSKSPYERTRTVQYALPLLEGKYVE
jgi:hypothetical protein